MDLEAITLSEMSDREKQILYDSIYNMESKKYIKLVNKTENKQTHRYREQTSGHQWGKGRGNIGVRDKRYQLERYIVQHGEYSQYFIINVNIV